MNAHKKKKISSCNKWASELPRTQTFLIWIHANNTDIAGEPENKYTVNFYILYRLSELPEAKSPFWIAPTQTSKISNKHAWHWRQRALIWQPCPVSSFHSK